MGKKYLKEEGKKKVLYEESVLGDKKLGELHEKNPGEYETRNTFGENFKIKEQKNFLDSAFDWLGPTAKKDYELKSSSGETGRFTFDTLSGRYKYNKYVKSKSYDFSFIDELIEVSGLDDGLGQFVVNIITGIFVILFGLLAALAILSGVLMVICLVFLFVYGLFKWITGGF
jgi:hypothetical protein